ncbi:MAG: thiamine biosynthesis protein ThiS [Spirochaetales bacterium]|nr:MAG: thiamine biosynthesis protein ThiS [Spirochaetales bacterium]
MITVKVKLSGLMRKYYRRSASSKMEQVEIDDGSTVGDVIESFGIPREKVHMVVVNKTRKDLTAVISNGDEIWVLPLAHGG